jgi:DNA-binding transcriptional LysR family regulator
MRADMELRHLRYFVAVAEALHFHRAAEVVHVAQPALSQQIRQLEQEIGVLLFERSHHKVLLTEAGKAFYLKAQSILKETRQAVTVARDVQHGNAGTAVIGFVSTAAIGVLPKVLANFREQAPRAEVELQELAPNEQIDSLYRGSIDLGFFHAKLDESAFDSLVVSRDRLIVALPKANKFARRAIINLKDLADETAIMPARHSTSGYFELARAAYQAAGIQPKRVHHTRLLQTGLLLVGAGLGVSLVPDCFRGIRVTGVVYRKLSIEPAPIELLAAWRRDNASPLLLRMIANLRTLQSA